MKRLNPLYLIFLALTVVFVSFYVLNNTKKEYIEKVSEFNTFEQKAKDYKSLKQQWSDKKYANNTINAIIKNRAFSKEKILFVETGDVLKVKIESNDPKILDNFLNKILNKPLVLKKLDIKKDSINLEVSVK